MESDTDLDRDNDNVTEPVSSCDIVTVEDVDLDCDGALDGLSDVERLRDGDKLRETELERVSVLVKDFDSVGSSVVDPLAFIEIL